VKEISCGIIIINEDNKILCCKPFRNTVGNDIPKGKMKSGESPIATAVRETLEETGLDFTTRELEYLGHFPYIKKKSLHLFFCRVDKSDRIDLNKLKCNTYFSLNDKEFPEIIDYKWGEISDLFPNLQKVFKVIEHELEVYCGKKT